MTIRSVTELLRRINDECPEAEMFRGQLENWPLLPSIGRYPNLVLGYDNWRGFHDYIISRFIRLARPYFHQAPTSDADWWVHAQHYGCPTRLLDWTTNPIKALFFTVNQPAHDSRPGVFWALTSLYWREDLEATHREYWDIDLVPFLPPQLNPRLLAQEGCFLSYPLPGNTAALKPVDRLVSRTSGSLKLSKFVIPATAKARLRRELATLGGKYRLLFPDADGVARGIKLEDLES
jgi:hypothetical protein